MACPADLPSATSSAVSASKVSAHKKRERWTMMLIELKESVDLPNSANKTKEY